MNNGVQISADGRLLRLPAEPSTAITAVKIKYEAGASGGGGGGAEVLIDTAGDLGGGHAAAVVAAEEGGEGEEEAGRNTCGTCGGIFCDCRPFAADSR